MQALIRLSCVLAVLLVTAVPRLAHANFDGTLDASLAPPLGVPPFWWGEPGLFDFGWDLGGGAPYTNADTVTSVLAQADGKFIVAGFSWNTFQGRSQNACTLARFNADGTLDAGFQGGRISRNFDDAAPNATDCYIAALALQGDGKIVAAGTVYDPVHRARGLVMRFNPDGTMDAGFNNGISSNPGWVTAGSDSVFNTVRVLDDGTIFTAGQAFRPGFSDNDMFWEAWSGDTGNASYWSWVPVNLGGDNDDRAVALVPDTASCAGPCLLTEQLYLVGTASMANYASGNAHHRCVVTRLKMTLLVDTHYVVDSGFGSNGTTTFEFGSPSIEPDSVCRVATRRYSGHGVTVGGERTFTSTLGGGSPGRASNYLLADIDQAASVSDEAVFAFFQVPPAPGIFNSINAMVRAPDGKLIVVGYAGTDVQDHGLSDGGVIRFNQDFGFDTNFGNDGAGRMIFSLDTATTTPHGRNEWASGVALDNQGRIVVAGVSASPSSSDSDWIVGRVHVWDGLFRDSFDGVVPGWDPEQ